MIKLPNAKQIKIMKTLQRKHKMGFHKARIVLDLYENMLQDCSDVIPFETVEAALLQIADAVIAYEDKSDYLENYTPEQLKQILEQRFGYKSQDFNLTETYLQKIFGTKNTKK